jgi:hypothetical protein
MTNERFDFRFNICRSQRALLPGFFQLFCATSVWTCTESTWGFAKLIKGRHATKVAIINLSGLFEITTVKYLNFYVSEIWCKCTFFIIIQKSIKLIFQFSDVFTDLFSSIFVSLKQSLLTKKNKHPKKLTFQLYYCTSRCARRF